MAFEVEDKTGSTDESRTFENEAKMQLGSDSLDDAVEMDGYGPTIQRKIFILLDEPDSSLPATLIGAFVMLLIVLGTITFCAETAYCIGLTREECDLAEVELLDQMKVFETVCILVFTIEYLARLATCTHRLSPKPTVANFMVEPMNLIDLVAILPFYIELILGGQLGLSVLRMLRMTRIFR